MNRKKLLEIQTNQKQTKYVSVPLWSPPKQIRVCTLQCKNHQFPITRYINFSDSILELNCVKVQQYLAVFFL